MEEWCEPLLRCCEGLYILEEETKNIVLASPYITEGLDRPCVGRPCWEAFLGRDGPCPFCPALDPEDGVYVWDYFDPRGRRWMKVKQLVFRRDGVLYRAGNINMIDEVMRLNYETVQEIAMLQSVLHQSRNDMTSLQREALCDTLTGLLNRNCYQLDLEREYADVPGLGVLYFDINNLKETNDRYRHPAGDALLRRVADVMRLVSSQFGNAKCYRIGGDEFVMLLTHCTMEALARSAKLFEDYMEQYNRDQPHPCSVAVGRAFSEGRCDPEMLVSQADNDMYRCKQEMKRRGTREEETL